MSKQGIRGRNVSSSFPRNDLTSGNSDPPTLFNSLPNAGQGGKPESIKMMETSSGSFLTTLQLLTCMRF